MNTDGSTVDLSNRVGQLFMMDNDFFRSPFMREKIPRMLFSNGMRGLENQARASSTTPCNHGLSMNDVSRNAIVRDVPIRAATLSTKPNFIEISSVRNSTPTLISRTLKRPDFSQPLTAFESTPDLLQRDRFVTNGLDQRSTDYTPHLSPGKSENTGESVPDLSTQFGSLRNDNTSNIQKKNSKDSWGRDDSLLRPAMPNLRNDIGYHENQQIHEKPTSFKLNAIKPPPTSDSVHHSFPISSSRSTTPTQNQGTFSNTAKLPPLMTLHRGIVIASSTVRHFPKPVDSGTSRLTRSEERRTNDFGMFPSSSLKSLPSLHKEPPKEEPRLNSFLSHRSNSLQEVTKPISSRTNSNPNLYPKTFSRPVESTDPVEEAIRSLETFDPNELINSGLNKNYSMSSPSLKVYPKQPGSQKNPTSPPLPTNKESYHHLLQTVEILRLNCEKMTQLSSRSGWRTYGELENNLNDMKRIFEVVKTAVNRICNDPSNIEQIFSRRILEELKKIFEDLQFMEADQWSSRKLWRGAWANEGIDDDLDRFSMITRKILVLLNAMDAVKEIGHKIPLAPSPEDFANRGFKERHRGSSITDLNYGTLPSSMPSSQLDRLTLPRELTSFYSSLPRLSSQVESQDVMDGGESTTSSTNSDSPTFSGRSLAESKDTLIPEQSYLPPDSPESRVVMEEDDLMSLNISMNVNETGVPSPFERPELTGNINEEDQEILEFCAIQVNQNNEKLNRLAQTFYNVIENGGSPDKFGQKAKMIVMVGKVQTQLAKNIASSLQTVNYKAEFAKTAQLLENTVNYCEESIQTAIKQYPQVATIQSLISAVNSICQQSQNLNILLTISMYKEI
ncbi:unnamed protein product [Bursaphelenchus xylophilus]|uniref:(pine wood nematode) hypothetical protein n=1 Tax=Bursaphelenchus xylophilus TaxID=6326 RepID=A0A1I7SDS4_BURXY|nr:unnamed protein product [Bursaphelenchus xylophilus]CAG9084344.1 unnamed protein product [Bursaphelenchus xylophilus]